MASEFKIRFAYNSRYYQARVVKSLSDDQMAYAVRPLSRTLAKGYGPQTLIYKKDDHYRCESRLSKTTPEYIDAIVNALKGARE